MGSCDGDAETQGKYGNNETFIPFSTGVEFEVDGGLACLIRS